MKILYPSCRDSLTHKDFQFICTVLAGNKRRRKFLMKLVSEPEARDKILDDKKLIRAILEQNAVLYISIYCYFYLLVRHALLQKGVMDRVLADYVASILVEFTLSKDPRHKSFSSEGPVLYFSEVFEKIGKAHPQEHLYFFSHLGNYSLFLSGLYEKLIEKRTERKAAPGMAFYEEMGRQHFAKAGREALAKTLSLENLYNDLSQAFTPIRTALNEVAQNQMHLHEGEEWAKVLQLFQDLKNLPPDS